MLKKILRLSAALAVPALITGSAFAQTAYQAGYQDPAYGDPAYQGNYQDQPALILYSGENFTGEAREIYDPIDALPALAFNDRARSVAVLAGQWEVCENSDFTGRCVFLRYDVPDLGWFGMNREVSSVRPVLEYTEAEHGLMFVRDRNGYIRYVDSQRYGYDDYRYGYGVSSGISITHYGYSPDYLRYGYYDPRLGYDPYGFGWTGAYGYSSGYRGYSSGYYRRELPPLRGHYGARDGAVTLYVDSNGRGASFGLNRGIADLSRYRFNDNVSSINIRSGQWEVCTDANFRGNCQIIDASVNRLNGLRLNDNISSIRPVGSTGHPGWDGPGPGDRGGRDGRDGRRTGGPGDRPRDGRGGSRPGAGLAPVTGTAPAAIAPPAVTAPRTATPRPARSDRDLAGGLPGTPAFRGNAGRSNDGAVGRDARRDVAPAPARPAPADLTQPRRSAPAIAPARTSRPAPVDRDVARRSMPPSLRQPVSPPARTAPPQVRRDVPAVQPSRVEPPARRMAPAVQPGRAAPAIQRDARRDVAPARPAFTPPPAPQPRASTPPPAPAPRASTPPPASRDDRSMPPAMRGKARPGSNKD